MVIFGQFWASWWCHEQQLSLPNLRWSLTSRRSCGRLETQVQGPTSPLMGLQIHWGHGSHPNCIPGWWFGTCFIFPYIGNNHPNWLMFFRGVEATNQIPYIDRFWFGSVQHDDLWGKARICWPYKCYAGELLHIWRIRICFLSWLLSGQVLLFRSWYPNYLVPFKVP